MHHSCTNHTKANGVGSIEYVGSPALKSRLLDVLPNSLPSRVTKIFIYFKVVSRHFVVLPNEAFTRCNPSSKALQSSSSIKGSAPNQPSCHSDLFATHQRILSKYFFQFLCSHFNTCLKITYNIAFGI